MSRAVTADVQSAIEDNNAISQRARLTLYKSRVFFEEADLVDNAPVFAHPKAETGMFISEAISWSGNAFTTVSIDYDGSLYLMTDGSAVPIQPEISSVPVTADPSCRPGIFGNAVFYYSDGTWRRLVFDESLLIAEDVDCVVSDGVFSDMTDKGGIYPTASNDAFLCYIKDGGIAIKLSIAGGDSIDAPGRLINPTYVYDATVPLDLYVTQFAGAASTPTGRFFYFSHYDGSVQCLKYNNGMFSDFFVSIPSDLSSSRIGSVFSRGSNIFMCVRFERKEEFFSDAKYTLFVKSTDGIVFSLDSRCLVSTEDYRVLAAFSEEEYDVIFSSTNRLYRTSAPYQIIGEDAESLDVSLVNVAGDSSSGWKASAISGGEEGFDNPLIMDGGYCKLEIGIQSADGDVEFTSPSGVVSYFKFIKYHDVILSSYTKGFGDADRQLVLDLVPDGVWHTSNMSHPFYMEVQGKQGLYDEATVMENLYKFSSDTGIKWTLAVDLWKPLSPPVTAVSHDADESDDIWSDDLGSILVDYPILGDEATYEMRLYGWSRAGLLGYPDETTDITTRNDTFYGLIEVEDDGGQIEQFVTVLADLSSSYSNPPQTYFDDGARDGSIPVVYDLPNPGEGKKIKRVGIRVESTSDGPTTYNVERIEFPGIAVQYKAETVLDEQAWEEYNFSNNWPKFGSYDLDASSGSGMVSFTPRAGSMYAIVVQGEASFDRGGIRYLQDPQFAAQISLSASPFAEPTWDRTYPPGTPPTPTPSVQVSFNDWEVFGAQPITAWDSILENAPKPNHAYMWHWEDVRWQKSEINPKFIPYFFADGTQDIEISITLAGSGTISNLIGGQFKVYVYEWPEDYRIKKYEDGFLTKSFLFAPNAVGVDFVESKYYQIDQSSLSNPSWGWIRYVVKNPSTLETRRYGISLKWSGVANSNLLVYDLAFRVSIYGGGTVVSQTWPIGPGDTFDVSHSAAFDVPANGMAIIDFAVRDNLGTFANLYPGNYLFDLRMWSEFRPSYLQFPAENKFQVTVPLSSGATIMDSGYSTQSFSGSFDIIKHPGKGGHFATNRKGVPQILLATRPYSAFNFEATARFYLSGPYATGGVVGIATDHKNYMLGYAKSGKIGLAKVRGGVRTNIVEIDAEQAQVNLLIDVRFWHRDGIFGVEVRREGESWPLRGSQVYHVWDGYVDGRISTGDDIFHVGTFATIAPPAVRITGFRSSSSVLGIMPLDLDPDTGLSGIAALPASGRLDIGGKIYTYTGKADTVSVPRGPFHLRGKGQWGSFLNKDNLGYSYTDNPAIEMLMFDWLPGDPNATDYASKVIATSAGQAWINDETLWRVWEQDGNDVSYNLDRSRWFSDTLPEYYAADNEKVWVTNGLTGVTAEVAEEVEYQHPEGSFAFLHSEDTVELHGFTAYSGDRDYSIADLLDMFSKISGTSMEAPGDYLVATVELDDNESQDLQ